MLRRAVLPLALLALAAAAPPAAAHAATLDADFPCYVHGESIVLAGAGFTPGGRVALSVAGQQLGGVLADSFGEFNVRVRMPRLSTRLRLRFVAADRADRALIAGALVRIVSPDVVVAPAGGKPDRPRRIRAWGFIGAGALYAHVKRRGAERARNIYLGRPRGACGTLRVKRRLFRRHPPSGRYAIKFDTAPRYLRHAGPSVLYSLTIFERARHATAALAMRPPG